MAVTHIALEKQLKAVANKRRLVILSFLKKEEHACVTDIAEYIKLSFKSTSRHLAVLHSANIIEREQISLSVFYGISRNLPSGAREIINLL